MTGLTAIAKLAGYAISDKPLSEQEWVENGENALQAAAGSSCWRMFWKLASSSSSAQNSEQYSLPEDERHA
jgi:hypothetical protein